MNTHVAEPPSNESFAIADHTTWSAIPIEPTITPIDTSVAKVEQSANHAALFAIDENRRGLTLHVEQSDVG